MQIQDVLTQWGNLKFYVTWIRLQSRVERATDFLQQTHTFPSTWFHTEFIRVMEAYKNLKHSSQDVI